MRKLLPFAGKFFDLGGIKYHYLDEGDGKPVVMLHGNPTWSFFYRNLAAALKDKYRVVVPDHVGCGLSDKPGVESYPYTLKRRYQDLEKLLEHLEIKKDVTLILHDWGGMIGMLYAVRNPEAVGRFVILNTAAFHLPPSVNFPWQLKLFRDTPVGDFLVRYLNAFCIGAAITCSQKSLTPEVRKGYLAPYDSPENRVAVLRFVQDIPLKPSDPSYQLVSEVENKLKLFKDRPMLICWGEKDFVFNHLFLEEWERRFPEAIVHRFPTAGHYVLEDAGDEITDLVLEFLEKNSIPGGSDEQ